MEKQPGPHREGTGWTTLLRKGTVDVSVVFGPLPYHAQRSDLFTDGALAHRVTSQPRFLRSFCDVVLQSFDAELLDFAGGAQDALKVAAMSLDAAECRLF